MLSTSLDTIILFFQNNNYNIVKNQSICSKYFLCSYNNNYFNVGEKCLFLPFYYYYYCPDLNVPEKKWYNISNYINLPIGQSNNVSPWTNYFLTRYKYNNNIFNVNLVIFTYDNSYSGLLETMSDIMITIPTPLKHIVYPVKIKINNQNGIPSIFIYSNCSIYSLLIYISTNFSGESTGYTTTFLCGECYNPNWLIYSYYSFI